jgi:hypothetical protein
MIVEGTIIWRNKSVVPRSASLRSVEPASAVSLHSDDDRLRENPCRVPPRTRLARNGHSHIECRKIHPITEGS